MVKIIDAARKLYVCLHGTLNFSVSYLWSLLVLYKGIQQLRSVTGMSSELSVGRK